MYRSSAISVVISVAIFIASGLRFALTPGPASMPGEPISAAAAQMAALTSISTPGAAPGPVTHSYSVDLAGMFLRPDNTALWLLMLLVWAALLIHACKVIMRMRVEPAPVRQTPLRLLRTGGDTPLSEHAALTLALLFGAAWPWVSAEHPVTGFMLAAAMFALALTAALRGQREGARIRHPQTIGVFAGWATAVTYAAFATLLNHHLGIPAVAATATAIVMCAAAGIIVQLKLGGTFSYSVAVIWSLVGLAAGTMTSDPTIATVAILGIAAMAIVLVRAAS